MVVDDPVPSLNYSGAEPADVALAAPAVALVVALAVGLVVGLVAEPAVELVLLVVPVVELAVLVVALAGLLVVGLVTAKKLKAIMKIIYLETRETTMDTVDKYSYLSRVYDLYK